MTQEERYKIINGDSLKVLDTIEPNNIDAIITDPPYELGFMGKKWDNTGIAYNVELWKKALKVLKPGGHLLAFGGTRTFHRIACAIEDAGFEIRDTIMWLYGSGFPKSHNVGLDIDKMNGCPNRGHRIATANRFHPDGTLEPNGENLVAYEGKTEDGKKWQGWGTALKPAYEPIIVARKPIEKTVANNVLKYGVGAINIDECRVETNESLEKGRNGRTTKPMFCFGDFKEEERQFQDNGRFPANIIHDGSEEATKDMPIGGQNGFIAKPYDMNNRVYGEYGQCNTWEAYQDSGSASRYFYCAKASKKDRDSGLIQFEERQTTDGCIRTNHETARKFGANSALRKNIHPTVKPVELMQYLVRLVSPKGATILDIFNGSGSTGKAVAFENRERNADYKYIGIELDKEYCEISKGRIDYAVNKFVYDIAEEIEEQKKTGQLSLFDFETEEQDGD